MNADRPARSGRHGAAALALAAALSLAPFAACRESSQPPPPTSSPAAAPRPSDDERFIEQIRRVVQQRRLSERPLACLDFVIVDDPAPGVRRVDAREKHDAACGGDPATAPRLFSVEVDRATGAVASDALSEVADLEPIPGARVAP